MAHGKFGSYSKYSGHLVKIVENMEMTCLGLREKRITLSKASIDCGARVKARKPVLKRKPQAQNGVTCAKAHDTETRLNIRTNCNVNLLR